MRSARNLCALDWMEANPGGLAADFKMYFDRLPKDELKVSFLLDPHVHMSNVALFVSEMEREGESRGKCPLSH